MPRVRVDQIDNYVNQTTGNYFTLKNDKETAQVRFVYDNLNDLEEKSMFAVHQVELNGKQRYVNCLREYNEPLTKCPLCAAKFKVIVKLFLIVYDLGDNQVKIWERGSTFTGKMSGLCSRYKPLQNTVFEIERHGKANDTGTRYEIFPVDTDKGEKNLPELPLILGGLVLDKTADEMDCYLNTGDFQEEEQPRRRESNTNNRQSEQSADEPVRRRRI